MIFRGNGKTKDRHTVLQLDYVPFNSCGNKVTFPYKGTIVLREKPLKTEYCIWTEDGKVDPIWGKRSEKDLDLTTFDERK